MYGKPMQLVIKG